MRNARLQVLAPLLLAAGAACSLEAYEDTGTPLDTLRAQQEGHVEALATAFCDRYYTCGCSEPWPDHEDEGECLEFVSQLLLGHLEQGLDEGLAYDPACLAIHVDLLEQLQCAGGFEVALDAELPALFEAAEQCRSYTGTVAVGEPCRSLPTGRGDNCAPGLHCHPDFATCVDTAPLGLGEGCAVEDRMCGAGLSCWANVDEPEQCIALREVGEPCPDGEPCVFSAYCDRETSLCTALASLGEACRAAEGGRCDFDLRCVNGTCVAAAAVGDPCDFGCAADLTCDTETQRCIATPSAVCGLQELLP